MMIWDLFKKLFTYKEKTILVYDGLKCQYKTHDELTKEQQHDYDIVPKYSLHYPKDLYPVVSHTGIVYWLQYDELSKEQKMSVINKFHNVFQSTDDLEQENAYLKPDQTKILRWQSF